jgi:chromosome segregation ATPase
MELNSTTLGLIFAALSAVIGYLSFNLGKKKEDKQEIKEDTTTQTRLEMQLEYIKQGVDDIKSELRDVKVDAKTQENKLNDLIEKLARIDESLKSAHKRIDELEKERK